MRRTRWAWWVLALLPVAGILAWRVAVGGVASLLDPGLAVPLLVALAGGAVAATAGTAGLGVLVWRRFGARSDFQVVDAGVVPAYELRAADRPVACRLAVPAPRVGGDEGLGHAEVAAPVAADAPPITVFETPRFPASLLVSLSGLHSANTVEFDDPAFDDRFVVECTDEWFARAVFTDAVRSRLLALDAVGTIRVGDGLVRHRIAEPRFGGGTFLDGDRLRAQGLAVAAVAAAVEEAGAPSDHAGARDWSGFARV